MDEGVSVPDAFEQRQFALTRRREHAPEHHRADLVDALLELVAPGVLRPIKALLPTHVHAAPAAHRQSLDDLAEQDHLAHAGFSRRPRRAAARQRWSTSRTLIPVSSSG